MPLLVLKVNQVRLEVGCGVYLYSVLYLKAAGSPHQCLVHLTEGLLGPTGKRDWLKGFDLFQPAPNHSAPE